MEVEPISTGPVLKVIILGETSVGKTSILNQWLHGTFSTQTVPTIAAGLSPVQLMIDGTVHSFQVWDTAGTPQFRSLVPMYCRSASIAVIVFDLTNSATFDRLDEWYHFVRETAQPMFIIAGNKLDLESHRRVHEATAADLARRFECPYVEISACTGEGMNAFGRAIIKCARQFISNQLLQAKEGVALHPESHTEGCNC